MNNDFQKQNQQWQNQGQGQNQPRSNPTSTGFSAFDSIPTQTNGGQQAAPGPFDWSMPPAPGASMQGRPAPAPAAGGFSDPWNLSSVPAPSQVLRSSPVRAPLAPVQPGNIYFIYFTLIYFYLPCY